MLPFIVQKEENLESGSYVFIPYIRRILLSGSELTRIEAYVLDPSLQAGRKIKLSLDTLDAGEREIILDGCLSNFYKKG
jgi:aconitate hydratase